MDFTVENPIAQNTIDQIHAIASDYVGEYFTPNFPDDMRVDMRFQRAALLKAGQEVVSCIVFTCLDGSPHITLMATKRAYSRKGCGRLLMDRFADHVAALGLRSIELYTFSPRTKPTYSKTVGFYLSAGFTIVREHKDLWGPGIVTLKMRKSW